MKFMNGDNRSQNSGDCNEVDVGIPVKGFGWMGLCIKCDKGGKLLVCHETGCPIAAHEECLGCPARFDEVGNFRCPYCSYRRALEKFGEAERKAVLAEKALSKFLDEKVVDTAPHKATDETLNLDKGTDVFNESDGLEEVRQEALPVPECSASTLQRKDVGVMLENKQSDISEKTIGDNGGNIDDNNRMMNIEKQIELETVVVCGDDGECCNKEGMIEQYQVIEVNKKIETDGKRQVDENKSETVIEDQQEAEHMSASHDAGNISTKEHVKNVEINGENGVCRVEEVQNQEQAHKTATPVASRESDRQVLSEGSREVDTADSISTSSESISAEETGVQPPSVGSLRRSPRILCSRQNENISTPSKSSKRVKAEKRVKSPKKPSNSPIPKEKRRRLAWKEEEVEMLKQGVQKFSKIVRKNLPWQAILEFGHGVFDETRTPADLKDKWKNILPRNLSLRSREE